MTKSDMYKQFLEAIWTGDYKNIVTAAYEYFKRPIMVLDVSYKKLMQIPDELVDDHVYDPIFNEGSITKDILALIESDGLRSHMLKNRKATYVEWKGFEAPRIIGILEYNNNVVGHYGILFKDENCTKEDLDVAELFRKSLGYVLGNKGYNSVKNNELSNTFLLQLMNGQVNREDLTSVWNNFFPAVEFGAYEILIATKPEPLEEDNIQYLCRILEENFHHCIVTNHENKVFTLFYNLGENEKRIIAKMENVYSAAHLLSNCGLDVGLSEIFFDITDFTDYLFMSEEALRLGVRANKKKDIFEFKDYALESMINQITKNEHVKSYNHKSIRLLKEYDKKHSTNYTETLRVYLLSFKNLTIASEQLNIHRNSLKYRLERITEISSINFSDEQLCAQLLINAYMSKYHFE